MFLQAHTEPAASFVWHVCSCSCAAGGQRCAVHQRQLVGGVCEDSNRAHPEESLPAGPQLHRGEAAAGGWEWETGEAWICIHKNAQRARRRRHASSSSSNLHSCFFLKGSRCQCILTTCPPALSICLSRHYHSNYDSSYLRKEQLLWHMHQRHTFHPLCAHLHGAI